MGILRIDEECDLDRIALQSSEWQAAKPISSERILQRIAKRNYPQFLLDSGRWQIDESLKRYESLLTKLRYEAAEDGCELNLASESDFRVFIRSSEDLQVGNLVLLDNGNLRMIWKDIEGTQLGLQFLGGKNIQFVIFKKKAGS